MVEDDLMSFWDRDLLEGMFSNKASEVIQQAEWTHAAQILYRHNSSTQANLVKRIGCFSNAAC